MSSFNLRNMHRTSASMFKPFSIACLVAVVSLGWTAFAAAQVPNTFNNGEVADADKINENFSYVLENASGGCTVEQVDNTAEITCADGSIAVVPGYGTVLVLPEGVVGETPVIDINTGPVVVMDANDAVLGINDPQPNTGYYRIVLGENISGKYNITFGYIRNDDGTRQVDFSARDHELYFTDPDCFGPIFSNGSFALVNNLRDGGFLIESSNEYTVLFKSRMDYEGACENGDFTATQSLMNAYTPSPEILNAAYPVRLEQLP